MTELILATQNPHKLTELQSLLPKYAVRSLAELHFAEAIPETGETLAENAQIKADAVYERFGAPCLADDTGLMVAALKGRPGVHSARYAGEQASYADNVARLLLELSDASDRSAYFATVLCYRDEQGKRHFFEGRVEGQILERPAGEAGFGYDPVFLPKGYQQSFAEMPADKKNHISHRGRALAQFKDFLEDRGQKS